MPTTHLPAASYEEAMPDLRAPYLASQVRPLIISAPEHKDAPCRIALFTIGETLMDRFNLCCGRNWEQPKFRIDIHEEKEKTDNRNKKQTIHYFKVTCTVAVFGCEHEDFGEGESHSAALAEYDARAQAFKRASRWFGPGQCLYVFGGEELKMWRGPGPNKLKIPDSGNDPHRRPFFEKAGRQWARDEYSKWLKDEGERMFGRPLDHLEIAEAIRDRALHRSSISVPDLSRALPDLAKPSTPPQQMASGERHDQQPAVTPAPQAEAPTAGTTPDEAEAESASAEAAASPEIQRLPMPDEPASQQAVGLAQSRGFAVSVAHALSNLAREDAQTGALSTRQEKTVAGWFATLSELHLTSEEIVKAVNFLGGNGTTQDARQATFTRWLSARARGQTTTPEAQSIGQSTTTASNTDPSDRSATPGEDAHDADADPEPDAAGFETERALWRIHKAMEGNAYTDRTVTRLAKLAIGVALRGKLDWEKVPPATMTVLAELLDCAAALEWSEEALGKEVLAAHAGNQQATPAGRFTAFAERLIDLAATHTTSQAA
jgi:hypothetical protein